MKITRRQLKRIIKEGHPRAFVDDILVDYEMWVEDNGHITPAASSVVATYIQERQLPPAGDEASVISQEYGIDIRDVHRELERLASEQSVYRMDEHGYDDDPYAEEDELAQYYDEFPELQKKPERDKEEKMPRHIARQIADEYGDLSANETFKMTKNQLRGIIREEKRRLQEQGRIGMPKQQILDQLEGIWDGVSKVALRLRESDSSLADELGMQMDSLDTAMRMLKTYLPEELE